MSCLTLGSLIHRKTPTSRVKPAAKKRAARLSEPEKIGTQPPLAAAVPQFARPRAAFTGRRFDGGPTAPAPASTPTPMPPRPPPASAPGGIPNVGSDAPEAINYPNAPAAAGATEAADDEATPMTGNWCCCCPE